MVCSAQERRWPEQFERLASMRIAPEFNGIWWWHQGRGSLGAGQLDKFMLDGFDEISKVYRFRPESFPPERVPEPPLPLPSATEQPSAGIGHE